MIKIRRKIELQNWPVWETREYFNKREKLGLNFAELILWRIVLRFGEGVSPDIKPSSTQIIPTVLLKKKKVFFFLKKGKIGIFLLKSIQDHERYFYYILLFKKNSRHQNKLLVMRGSRGEEVSEALHGLYHGRFQTKWIKFKYCRIDWSIKIPPPQKNWTETSLSEIN